MSTYSPFNPLSKLDKPSRNAEYLMNGRVLIDPSKFKQYELFENSSKQSCISSKLISNTLTPTTLAAAYFSQSNINLIQDRIKSEIQRRFKHTIGRQSDSNLQIIMRSYYLQFARNLPDKINEQIDELNTMVVEEAVRIIGPNIEQQLAYIKDISNPRQVMPLPIMTRDYKQLGNSIVNP